MGLGGPGQRARRTGFSGFSFTGFTIVHFIFEEALCAGFGQRRDKMWGKETRRHRRERRPRLRLRKKGPFVLALAQSLALAPANDDTVSGWKNREKPRGLGVTSVCVGVCGRFFFVLAGSQNGVRAPVNGVVCYFFFVWLCRATQKGT